MKESITDTQAKKDMEKWFYDELTMREIYIKMETLQKRVDELENRFKDNRQLLTSEMYKNKWETASLKDKINNIIKNMETYEDEREALRGLVFETMRDMDAWGRMIRMHKQFIIELKRKFQELKDKLTKEDNKEEFLKW